jgi:hypothetical protein
MPRGSIQTDDGQSCRGPNLARRGFQHSDDLPDVLGGARDPLRRPPVGPRPAGAACAGPRPPSGPLTTRVAVAEHAPGAAGRVRLPRSRGPNSGIAKDGPRSGVNRLAAPRRARAAAVRCRPATKPAGPTPRSPPSWWSAPGAAGARRPVPAPRATRGRRREARRWPCSPWSSPWPARRRWRGRACRRAAARSPPGSVGAAKGREYNPRRGSDNGR